MIIIGKVQTWDREIDGLFDYENKKVLTQDIKFNQSGQLVRNGNQVQYKNSTQSLHSHEHQLASCFKVEENLDTSTQIPIKRFFVAFDKFQLRGDSIVPQDKAYLVVKTLKLKDGTQKGYALKVGDYLKFGRIEFFVKQIRDEEGTVHKAQIRHRIGQRTLILDKSLQPEQKIGCRICLDEENTGSNPLVNACNCKGTINYIHVECLNQCIKSRIKQSILPNVTSYKLKSIQCEICKADYPTKIQSNSSKYSILSLQKPNVPYMLLQSSTDKTKRFFFIHLEGNEKAIIGRKHEAQINIQDVTVSRYHGWISKDVNNQYVVYDNQSKFGTLIELKNQLKITQEPVSCQVGRSLITFSVQ